jgi:Putative restriction endonuclease
MRPTVAGTDLGVPRPSGGHIQATVIEDRVRIPASVMDLASFRSWALSDDYPETGQFAYLAGQLWMDLSMEELLTHNQVRIALTMSVGMVLKQETRGQCVVGGMRLSNADADLFVEPVGLFYLWTTAQMGKLRFVTGKQGDIMELEGTPDMVLEIVSGTSVIKDTVQLRELYWRAGVTEYWLVDARGSEPLFEILFHTPAAYVPAESGSNGPFSTVLGRAFQLVRGTDPLGRLSFEVRVS